MKQHLLLFFCFLLFSTPSVFGQNLRGQIADVDLKKIDFAGGNYGLFYDKNKNKYGFIDKELNTKIEFKYDEAKGFDGNTGFAKVKKENIPYLIDIFGIEYKLATDITQLDSSILALDLSKQNLEIIPPSVFLINLFLI